MAGKTIDMEKLKKVLKLYTKGQSKSFISKTVRLSRNTVKKYIDEFIRLRQPLDERLTLSDDELEKLFIRPINLVVSSPRLQALYSFFPYAEKELKKIGVTKNELWQEYKKQQPDGVQSTQFCEHFNRWMRQSSVTPSMRMIHKAGDKLLIDYAGKPLVVIVFILFQ